MCEGVRVALALNAPIITRCKCLTASRFLDRLRLGRHTKRGEGQHLKEKSEVTVMAVTFIVSIFRFLSPYAQAIKAFAWALPFAFNLRQAAWQILPTTLLSEFHLKKQGPSKFFA